MTYVINPSRFGGGSSSLLTDLVSWWSMDETGGTRADSHGSNDLTDNSTVLSVTGKQSNAADFVSGNLEYLSLANADTAGLSVGDNDFSMAGWVNLDTTAAIQDIAGVAVSTLTANTVWLLRWHTSTAFRFYVASDTTFYSVDASTFGTPSTGTWCFLYAYYDAAANEIGISVNDGTVDTTGSVGAPNTPTAPDLYMGRYWNTRYCNFSIDEFAFWSRKLTAAEVTDLYNSGSGISYPG